MTSRKRVNARDIARFRKVVLSHHQSHGRHSLPWRKTKHPYRILVSEVMLQQTQVDRVIPYYTRWMKQFPTASSLAGATLKDVLLVWQGLGYNRRAKMLYESARTIVTEYKGRFPRDARALERLKGVGPYTARAVMAFAHNQDEVFVETNIRTAILHHFFPTKKSVSDAQILSVASAVLPKGRAREWYSALMDYGAYLKKQGARTNHQVKGYTKQKAFLGSNREVRGRIVRALLTGPVTQAKLTQLFDGARASQVHAQLQVLLAEGLIEKAGGRYRLPS